MTSLQRAIDPLSGPVRHRNRRRNPFWRFRRFLFSVVLLVVGAIGAVLYTFSQTTLPEDRFEAIAQTSFLCTAEVTSGCGPDNATVLLSTAGEDREIITYEELPQSIIDAVVATEDQSYFEHQGIDPRGITRAAYQFVRQEGVTQGGSTITQQYVKLAFNDADRTLVRKAREAIRAVKLEQDIERECSELPTLGERTPERCAKEEILTRYLNRAYFGRGASGVQAAARTYFGKDVGELEVAESAFLAGLLRNPNGADPDVDREEANRRRTTSLQLMFEAGYISQADAAEANASEWRVVPRRDREGLGEVKGADVGTEYFIEEVRQQLDELYPNGEIYTSGIRVYTTLDPRLQRAAYNAAHAPKPAEDIEARGKPELGPTYLDPNNPNDPAAAIVSLDRNGRVVAMLGGTNFDDEEFNLATSSGTNGRQPGSTFKPIGLAVAIEQGISAQSFYPAIPGVTRVGAPCQDKDGAWQVTGGSSGRYRYRDLVDALTWSSNVVFAQLVVDIRPEQLRVTAEKLGVGSDLINAETGEAPCSLILGGKEVPVIDMATVYSTFERGGSRLDPVLIERVENIDGEVICWYPVDGVCSEGPDRVAEQVISPSTNAQVTYAMTQVVDVGTGKAARFDENRAVAGKTGTSQNNVDGWFAGFTCGMTTVVWMGYDGDIQYPMIDFRMPREGGGIDTPKDEQDRYIDNRDWPNVDGGTMPTWIWSAYMAEATALDAPCESLPIETEFPGVRLNQDLSTTTLPPCGVELDGFGFPRGSDPETFRYITTTTAAPTTTTTAPPTTAPPGTQPPTSDTQPPSSDTQPQGLPLQETTQPPPQQETTTTVRCIAPEQWIYQANPDAPRPTNPDGTPIGGDPNQPGGGDTTTQTAPPSSQAPAPSNQDG